MMKNQIQAVKRNGAQEMTKKQEIRDASIT